MMRSNSRTKSVSDALSAAWNASMAFSPQAIRMRRSAICLYVESDSMVWTTALRGGRNHFSCSDERLPEAGDYHKISVLPDTAEAARAKRRECVLVLQTAELSLDGGATPVEALPFVGAVRDRRERDRATLPQADDGTTPRSRVSSMTRLLSYPRSMAHVSDLNPRAWRESRSGAI
jgi:hypothetical protein